MKPLDFEWLPLWKFKPRHLPRRFQKHHRALEKAFTMGLGDVI